MPRLLFCQLFQKIVHNILPCTPIWYPLQRNWVSSSTQKGRKSYWCHWQNSYLSRVISHVKAHPLIQWILNIWKGQTLTFPSPLLLMQAWVLWLMKVSQAFSTYSADSAEADNIDWASNCQSTAKSKNNSKVDRGLFFCYCACGYCCLFCVDFACVG